MNTNCKNPKTVYYYFKQSNDKTEGHFRLKFLLKGQTSSTKPLTIIINVIL